MKASLSSVQQFLKEKGRGGLFSSVCIFPSSARFETQDPEEEIILLLRPHIITNWWWVLLSILLSFVPLAWPYLPVISLLPVNYLFVLTLFWYALVLSFVFEQFIMWFFSVNIVTDERIIDVDFFGLLFKKVDVAQIDKIQDINYSQQGVLASFANFGDVMVQTAAEIPEFVFNKVPSPERVVKILSELVQVEQKEELEGRVR